MFASNDDRQDNHWLLKNICWSTAIAWVLAAASAHAGSPADVFAKVSPSIVVVQALDGNGKEIALGSGVAFAATKVVTNCHVVQGGDQLKVRSGPATYTATLEFSDHERDLCQLTVPGGKLLPVRTRATASLKQGERVVAIGTPLGFELTVSEGLLSAVRERPAGRIVLQTTAPISPGSSGGGLFDESGNLIGITTFFRIDGQAVNFAVSADHVAELKGRHKPLQAIASSNPVADDAIRQIADLGKRLRTSDPQFDKKLPFIQRDVGRHIEANNPPETWVTRFVTAHRSAGFELTAQALLKSKAWQQLVDHGTEWARAVPDSAVAYITIARALTELSIIENEIAVDILGSGTPPRKQLNKAKQHSARARDLQMLAIQGFQHGLELDPRNVEGWLRLGAAYVAVEDAEGARAIVETLRGLDPKAAQSLSESIALIRHQR